METVTFYSYKGGVGRTLALANTAMYLSRFGQNVCIMDFDLEAPGLHYKFPKLVKMTDIGSGLVDYIYEFVRSKVIPESLNEYTSELISPSKSQGGIRLFPAGNSLSPDYWLKLAAIDWHSLFYEEDSEGVPFFLELKERIKEKFSPDYLLIDARTGITEMSGLCTSLLPDKVVFLIVNNQENIEGARQILQSIQKIERFPGQGPIEVIFALTRIPFPQKDEDERIEKQILKNIRNCLNEPVEDLEGQLDVDEICILHSDRELELSESLRVNQEGITKGIPLSGDYLRLFSRIIPEKVILPRLDSILEEITAPEKLREDPDRVQQELEGIVASYLHPRSLEKLIKFYILHNAGREKILNAFHELWKTFGIDDPELLSEYVLVFMKWELLPQMKPRFELEIVEKYLKSNPEDKVRVARRLANAYWEYGNPKMALKHYFLLLEGAEEKDKILWKILDICIDGKLYDDAMKFIEKYSDIIEGNVSLRVKEVEVLYEVDKIEEVKLDDVLREGLVEGSLSELLDIGRIYYKLGKENEFRNKIIEKHPESDYILYTLDKYRYKDTADI